MKPKKVDVFGTKLIARKDHEELVRKADELEKQAEALASTAAGDRASVDHAGVSRRNHLGEVPMVSGRFSAFL